MCYMRIDGTKADAIMKDQPLLRELTRKSLHMLIAFLPLIAQFSRTWAFVLLVLGSLVYSSSELVRIRNLRTGSSDIPSLRWLQVVTEFVSRGNESESFILAPVTLALGAAGTLLLFDGAVMQIGIFALAFGDTAAALVGRLAPIIRLPLNPGKSLGGFLGCLSTTAVLSYVVTQDLQVSLLASLCSALLESLPIRDLDNLILPLGTALCVSALL